MKRVAQSLLRNLGSLSEINTAGKLKSISSNRESNAQAHLSADQVSLTGTNDTRFEYSDVTDMTALKFFLDTGKASIKSMVKV